MTEKITLNIFFDGTGNNKVNDRPANVHTNVARLHDTLHADYRFNISAIDPLGPEKNGTSDPALMEDKHLEGNLEAFDALFGSSGEDPSSPDAALAGQLPDREQSARRQETGDSGSRIITG